MTYLLDMKRLILKTELYPIRIATPTNKNPLSTKLLTWNYVLTMNHMRRSRMHKDFMKAYNKIMTEAITTNSWGHSTGMTYSVSIGFSKGKAEGSCRKTGRLDTDNIGYYLKMAQDAFTDKSALPDDNCELITEARCVYLGPSEDGEEHLIFQVCVDDHKVEEAVEELKIGDDRNES